MHPASGEGLRRREDRRGARGIVFGSVIDGVSIDGRPDPEVIVVAPDQDGFGCQGPPTRELSQDIAGTGALNGAPDCDVELNAERHRLELTAYGLIHQRAQVFPAQLKQSPRRVVSEPAGYQE